MASESLCVSSQKGSRFCGESKIHNKIDHLNARVVFSALMRMLENHVLKKSMELYVTARDTLAKINIEHTMMHPAVLRPLIQTLITSHLTQHICSRICGNKREVL